MSVTSRTVKKVAIGANMIPIAVAEYVRGNGWKRQIDSINKTLLQSTVEKVAAAIAGSNLGLTKNEKDRTNKIVVQYACIELTVQNRGAKSYTVLCRILVQRTLESTPLSLAKIKPGRKCLGNTFLMIRVRML